LIVFLHGAAERGVQLDSVLRQGLPRLLGGGPDLSPAEQSVAADISDRFIVVAPQCAPYEVWDDLALLALLDELAGDTSIDPARIYLTGLSMGGFGVWSLGLRHPDRFAALAPICGGGRIADVKAAARLYAAVMERLGIWAFHGANDLVVPVDESIRMVEALQLAGVPGAKLTIYPDADHDAWTATYANPELYRWLLRHSR
jgi:predicted peptidase